MQEHKRKTMMTFRYYIAAILVCILAIVAGCGPAGTSQTGMHELVDGMGHKVTVPIDPQRIVPIGVSTEDVVLSLVNPDRVVALGTFPNNVPDLSKPIQNRVKASAESVLAQKPDLVIVPDWISPDAIDEMQAMNIPLYVYKTPKTVEDAKQFIATMGTVLYSDGQPLLTAMDKDLESIYNLVKAHAGPRPTVVFYSQFGVTGGKGSTFDDMCRYLDVTNGAAQIGLGPVDNGTREDLIRINPDVIIVPSAEYSSDAVKAFGADQLYSDPSLQVVKAVQNHRIYVVDAGPLMSYSQFMTKAMLQMAKYIYE